MRKTLEIVDVQFISSDRAAIKAVGEGGVCWRLTDRREGEEIAASLADELREP